MLYFLMICTNSMMDAKSNLLCTCFNCVTCCTSFYVARLILNSSFILKSDKQNGVNCEASESVPLSPD